MKLESFRASYFKIERSHFFQNVFACHWSLRSKLGVFYSVE